MVLLIVGALATGTMVLSYALEPRSPHFIGLLALASAVGAGYGFAIEAWPFGALEAVWTVVAARRYLHERRGRTPMPHESESPLACDMSAMSDAQRARHASLSETLRGASALETLPDGYALRFAASGDTYLRVAEWVSLERLCCPFLRFDLRLDAGADVVELRMTGREGVREFLAEELGLAS